MWSFKFLVPLVLLVLLHDASAKPNPFDSNIHSHLGGLAPIETELHANKHIEVVKVDAPVNVGVTGPDNINIGKSHASALSADQGQSISEVHKNLNIGSHEVENVNTSGGIGVIGQAGDVLASPAQSSRHLREARGINSDAHGTGIGITKSEVHKNVKEHIIANVPIISGVNGGIIAPASDIHSLRSEPSAEESIHPAASSDVQSGAYGRDSGLVAPESLKNKNLGNHNIDSVQTSGGIGALGPAGDIHSDRSESSAGEILNAAASARDTGLAMAETSKNKNVGSHDIHGITTSGRIGTVGQAGDIHLKKARFLVSDDVQSEAYAGGQGQSWSESSKNKNVGSHDIHGITTSGGIGTVGQAGDIHLKKARFLVSDDVQSEAYAGGQGQSWSESSKNKNVGSHDIHGITTSGGIGTVGQAGDIHLKKARFLVSDDVQSGAYAGGQGQSWSESSKNKNLGNHNIHDVHTSGGIGVIGQSGDVHTRNVRSLFPNGAQSGAYASGQGQAWAESSKNKNIGNQKIHGVQTSGGIGVIGQAGDIHARSLFPDDIQSAAYASGHGQSYSLSSQNLNKGDHSISEVHTTGGIGVIGQSGDIHTRNARSVFPDDILASAHASGHGQSYSSSSKNLNKGDHSISGVNTSGGIGVIGQAGDIHARKFRSVMSDDVQSAAYASGQGLSYSASAQNINKGDHQISGVNTSGGIGVIGQSGNVWGSSL